MIWNLEDRNRADWVAALRDAYEEFEAGTPQVTKKKKEHIIHVPYYSFYVY